MNPKYTTHKCPKYVKWIKGKKCLINDVNGVDPHHVDHGRAWMNDFLCVPLTRDIHNDYHRLERKAFEKKYNINLDHEIINLLSDYIEEIS